LGHHFAPQFEPIALIVRLHCGVADGVSECDFAKLKRVALITGPIGEGPAQAMYRVAGEQALQEVQHSTFAHDAEHEISSLTTLAQQRSHLRRNRHGVVFALLHPVAGDRPVAIDFRPNSASGFTGPRSSED
jgi:hypothetical protein